MNRTFSLVFGALATLAGFTLQATELSAQKAAIYCAEATGCGNVANALAGSFPGGVDRVFNGTSGTVDIRTVDMSQYAVFFVPSLSDNGSRQPYALLRDGTVAAKLSAVLTGRVAVWSGTPDQGKASRDSKDALIRNLAQYAAAEYATTKAPGLVVLQDASATMSARYNWLAGISGRSISADPTAKVFGRANGLTETGKQILGSLAYGNMGSFGLSLPGDQGWEAGAAGAENTVAFNGLTSTGALGMSGAGVVNTIKAMWASMFSTANVLLATNHGNKGSKPTIRVYRAPALYKATGQVFRATLDASDPSKGACFNLSGIQLTFKITAQWTGAFDAVNTNVAIVGPATPALIADKSTSTHIEAEWAANLSSLVEGTTYTVTATNAYADGSSGKCGSETVSANFTLSTVKVIPTTTTVTKPTNTTVGTATGATVVTRWTKSDGTSGTYTPAPAVVYEQQDETTGQWTWWSGTTAAPTQAGFYRASAHFAGTTQPDNDGFVYGASSGSDTYRIGKLSQTITFGPLSNKTFGDAVFEVNATATSGLPVSFTAADQCSVAKGTDGKWMVTITGAGSCTVTASQAGDATYNEATPVAQSFSIAKAATTITWSNPADITYGALLSGTQLNATANVAGTFTYTPVSGTKLNVGDNQTLKVDFVPTDATNYGPATKTVTINVKKANQTITFGELGGKTFGDAAFTVSASSDSKLAVSFAAEGNCTISGSTVSITSAGSCKVTASQAGDDNYNAATAVERSFSISKASATLTLSNLEHTYNASAKAATVTVSPSGVTGVVVKYYIPGAGGQEVLAADLKNAGEYDVVATLTNDNYSATNATGKLVINRAAQTITWSNPANITFGTKLSAEQLNATAAGALTYSPALGAELNAGTHSLKVTAAATDNFLAAEKTVSITVDKAAPSFTWAPLAAINYGTDLTGLLNASSGGVAGTFAYTNGTAVVTAATKLDASTTAYTLTATFTPTDATNYTGGSVTNSLTVNKATVTVTPNSNQSKVFGATEPALTFTNDGGLTATDFNGALARAAGEDVGTSYAINLGTLAAKSSNYTLTLATTTVNFAITAKSVTFQITENTKSYDGTAKTATVTPSDANATFAVVYKNAAGTEVSPTEAGTYSITATASGNYSGTASGTLTITNGAPVITEITGIPASPVALGAPMNIGATFTDPGVATDQYTAEVVFASGGTTVKTWAANVTYVGGSGSLTASGSDLPAGVYTVTVTVTDKFRVTGSKTADLYAVVYDPNGGFVTGNGWFTSQAGWCTLDATCTNASGRAHFGFVSKYVQGKSTPVGHTVFQFKAGGLQFHSTSYETLVVSGDRAQYWGSGTVNGQSGFTFRLTAVDAQTTGSTEGTDKFRIEIWRSNGGAVGSGTRVYDNQLGAKQDAALTTAIESGNITIKK